MKIIYPGDMIQIALHITRMVSFSTRLVDFVGRVQSYESRHAPAFLVIAVLPTENNNSQTKKTIDVLALGPKGLGWFMRVEPEAFDIATVERKNNEKHLPW